MKKLKKDELEVRIFESRDAMGKAAAADVAACIRKLLAEKDEISMIFAAAPSQNEVLAALVADKSVEWGRINAYHMDEYVGIDKDCPAGFANFLRNAIFDKVGFKTVNTLDCTSTAEAEIERYSKLLSAAKIDICCLGIGENGHIAFNDPHVADFNDKALVKKVGLDEVCRMQQVHDGCFPDLASVPEYALTLTIPELCSADYMFCVVPASTKAQAVKNTVNGPVSEDCPATILRTKKNSVLYLDADSSALL